MYEQMNFPETPQEFIKQYAFKDKKEIYTNGSMLIPVFRVETLLAHYIPKIIEERQEKIDILLDMLVKFENESICNELCGWNTDKNGETWCSRNCGTINDGTCPSRECYLEYLKMKEYYENKEQ